MRLTFDPLRRSGRRQRPAALDRQRRPDWPRPLPGDHLLRGLLQPAGGRVGQRDRRRPGERRGQVGVASKLVTPQHFDWAGWLSQICFSCTPSGPGCGARGI